jgi:type II restriction/modification system DNA methylase subunit YeeA
MFTGIANRSLMGPDNLLDYRKPNGRAFRFGGKERLKNIYAADLLTGTEGRTAW